MKSGLNGFNRIARHYDRLKRLVFGRAIYQSQIFFLSSVPNGGKVLFPGGGTGEILPLLKEQNDGIEIWFIEASSEMLRMAMKRLPPESGGKIRFVHGTESDLPEGVWFDAVITNFFLDLFPDSKVTRICAQLAARLRPGGVWVASDFVDGKKAWQRILLALMYRFFQRTSHVEARQLPVWGDALQEAGMEEISSAFFYRGFIKSVLYRKKPDR